MKLIKRSSNSPSLEPSSHADIFNQWSSIFDNWFNDRWFPSTDLLSENRHSLSHFNPAIDVSETDTHINVRANIPGIDADDITIEVSDDTLSLSGEMNHSDEEKGENYYRMERRMGSFSREMRLPHTIDPDSVEAKAKDGVLRISMKKQEDTNKKKISIKKE